jgi:hypothetical protein
MQLRLRVTGGDGCVWLSAGSAVVTCLKCGMSASGAEVPQQLGCIAQ